MGRISISWSVATGRPTVSALLSVVAMLVSICLAPPAGAAVFSVNDTGDADDASPGNGVCATPGGVCTLRAAVREANALGGADTINIPPGTFLLTIDGDDESNAVTGDLDIEADLTIVGSGISATILDANGLERMFEVTNGTVSISDLTIQGGDVRFPIGSGGGIKALSGTNLTMTDVVVQNNLANTGGGLAVDGTITMVDVTIDNNTADESAGGVRISTSGNGTLTAVTISNNDALSSNGGGILQEGTSLIATNVTISGNTSANRGGGLYDTSSATLQNVTIRNNSASGRGGGFEVFGGSLTLRNTLVAGNTAPQSPDVRGTVTSLGNNLIGNSSGGAGFVASDILDVAPSLGGLADNGGPTQTHALLAGSRGIDEGTGTGGPPTDQRGVSRPLDGDGDTIATYDIGAYEYEGPIILQKRAFQYDGTPIPEGATIPDGLLFHFLLYINNFGPARTDISIQDVLDPAFAYQTGTLRVDNSVSSCAAACTPVEEAAVFAAVSGTAPLTDSVDGDVISYTVASSTVDAGNESVANGQLDIATGRVWALLFSAKLQ
ncbi:MAG: right-handed parallel beta-helix repeat-containing protein [Gammaproteobacteria bacterium]|nr:right-handed parallel beta-helix repeat-containing protein [Gammaproteobacteria bacterium]